MEEEKEIPNGTKQVGLGVILNLLGEELNAEATFNLVVKKDGLTGRIPIQKKYIGREVKVIIKKKGGNKKKKTEQFCSNCSE